MAVDHSPQQRRSRRLAKIYQKLDDAVDVAQSEDPILAMRMLDWMERFTQTSAAGLIDHLESELTDIETSFEMHRAGGDGEAEFPDRCEGCPHYGVACPLFTHPTYTKERDRKKRELQDARELEVKLEYRQLAGRTDCHVITDEIDRWEDEYKDLLQEGIQLRREVAFMVTPKDLADLSEERLRQHGLDRSDFEPFLSDPDDAAVEADGGTDTQPPTDDS